jgi:hypothetical protein
VQRVKSAPPLPMSNQYQVLSVDELEDEDSETYEVPVAQPPKTKRVRKKRWEHQLPTKYIISTTPSANSLSLKVEIETNNSRLKHGVEALVDCGATGLFVDMDWIQTNSIPTCALSSPINVYNVDGTLNEAGAICEVVMVIMQYGKHKERATFTQPFQSIFMQIACLYT